MWQLFKIDFHLQNVMAESMAKNRRPRLFLQAVRGDWPQTPKQLSVRRMTLLLTGSELGTRHVVAPGALGFHEP